MIYRQVIPPAPAYLGLNLFLKGTQVTSKNGGGGAKKEKPKLETKPKTERRSSLLTVKTPGQNGENDKTPILSPRSLLIDFNDLNNNNTKKRIGSFTKASTENMLKNDKVISTRMHSYLALARCPPKHSDSKDPLSGRKPIPSKVPDSSRRHASCGPKLMSIAPQDDGKTETANVIENDRKNIKCVGNKCGPDVEITDADKTNAIESNKSSPRKPTQDVSPLTGIRTKLKPLTALSKSAKPISCSKETSSAATPNDYRKYLTRSSLQLNRIPSKHPIHSHNSHFYAVGLSLRAWRSKYNRIKENTAATSTSKTTAKSQK